MIKRWIELALLYNIKSKWGLNNDVRKNFLLNINEKKGF